MAVKRKIPLTKINGVAAGATATIDLPTNVRYHALFFQFGCSNVNGPTEANCETFLTQWRLNLNSTTQRIASTAQIFDINRTKGRSPTVGATEGYIEFYFSEPHRESTPMQEATAWGMKGVDSFQIEVDLHSTVTAPTLTGFAIVDDVQEPPAGIVKWKRETIQVSATGDLTYRLNTDRGDSYQGLFFFEGTAGDINNIRLEWDGVKLFDMDENDDDVYRGYIGSTTVSGCFHIPLDDNNPADAVPTVKRLPNGQLVRVQEFDATLTMGAAANVTLIREVVGAPD